MNPLLVNLNDDIPTKINGVVSNTQTMKVIRTFTVVCFCDIPRINLSCNAVLYIKRRTTAKLKISKVPQSTVVRLELKRQHFSICLPNGVRVKLSTAAARQHPKQVG